MGLSLPNLNALRVFEAAGRRLSFSDAAAELGVTQGAVSRQIKSLETELGVALFRRMTRSVQLSDEGHTYFSNVREVFDRLERATQQLRAPHQKTVITVNVFPTFAMQFLVPRLPRFAADHPDFEIRLVMSIEPVNFEEDDVDIAIRVALPRKRRLKSHADLIELEMVKNRSGVRLEQFMPDVIVPVCNRRFLRRYGPLRKPGDLRGVPLVQNPGRGRSWPDWFDAFNLAYDRAAVKAFYSHYFMSIEAAREGLGLALVPKILVATEVERGSLVQLSHLAIEGANTYYLLCRDHQWQADPIRRFRDWLLRERDSLGDLTVARVTRRAKRRRPLKRAAAR